MRKLFEDEEDFIPDDLEDEILDDEEESDDIEINDESEEYEENELIRKEIIFPILINSFDEEDNPTETNPIDAEDFVNEYSDAVINNFEENKKFILSALDVFDFEIYFKEFDLNSNIHFTMELSKDVTPDLLINTIKRYFKVDLDNFNSEDGYLTLDPVLENKYLIIN